LSVVSASGDAADLLRALAQALAVLGQHVEVRGPHDEVDVERAAADV